MEPWDHGFGQHRDSWTSLYAAHELVGFRKKVAETYFYSTDGYAWSGTAIEFDREQAETGLRDRSDARVFDGDWVLLPARHGERQAIKVVVLKHPEWGPLCWMPEHDWITPVSTILPNPQRGVVTRVLGSIHQEPGLDQRAAHIIATYDPDAKASLGDVLSFTATVSLATAAMIWLQMQVWQSVGPFMTIGGYAAGSLLYFALRHQLSPGWLVRERLRSMAKQGSFVLSILVTGTYATALLLQLKGFKSAAKQPTLAIIGVAMVAWVISFVIIVLCGDLVSWWTSEEPRTGGKQ